MELKDKFKKGSFLMEDIDFLKKSYKFSKLLLNFKRIHNITRLKNMDDVEKNIFNSIYPLRFLPKINTALDVGSGAGFPGLILAMQNPLTHFVLLEPNIKRVAFLYLAKSHLDIKNITIVRKRIQDLDKKLKFDLITSRALYKTSYFIKLVKPFTKNKTVTILYKGSMVLDIEKDIQEKKLMVVKNKNIRYLIIKNKEQMC